ncbi:hypothetical protein OIU77_015854 [Salix suchowensis]|uniref:DOG1 domain-containing protein n=1 Tax=Salix suchowensis TaxID=1278906 RepID=A0ABQ8ZIL6_9ROSI|nr:hypothetical protein OIU77_015854 [Salix suchowensis]
MSSSSSFTRFYDTWFDQLNQLLEQLRIAPKPPSSQDDRSHLSSLAQKILLGPPASRGRFTGFLGWRPTTLFHLVYTESSILFEFHIADILKGQSTGDLGDLSPNQFRRVSELQCETVKEENAITGELSEWQDSAAEVMLGPFTDLGDKIGRLVSVVKKADDLRLRTIRRVVDLLTTQQAVEFLVAAGELQFGVYRVGEGGWITVHVAVLDAAPYLVVFGASVTILCARRCRPRCCLRFCTLEESPNTVGCQP